MKKHALIIGGTRGTGRVLTKLLSEEDYAVSVIGRREPQEKDLDVKNVAYWIGDLTDREFRDKAFQDILNKNGLLNSLIFLQRYRGKEDKWRGELETSLTATIEIIESLADKFANGDNSIVLISSNASNYIISDQPLGYHVAKSALVQMARFYAASLGPRGIRVNAVSPNTILKEESSSFYLQNEKLQALYKKIIPLGRMCTSSDVANVISFLCSEKASFITGQNIVVDGGASLSTQESIARRVAE